jgi:hypothetical protein
MLCHSFRDQPRRVTGVLKVKWEALQVGTQRVVPCPRSRKLQLDCQKKITSASRPHTKRAVQSLSSGLGGGGSVRILVERGLTVLLALCVRRY